MRNLILTAMLAMASLFGMAAQADDYTAGKEYVELSSPVPVSQPGKIEVVELFWYGCPHCYAFEPTIVPWSEAAGRCSFRAPACPVRRYLERPWADVPDPGKHGCRA